MNTSYQKILHQIQAKARNEQNAFMSTSYSGSTHKRYGLTVPETRLIAKTWAKEHQDFPLDEYIELVNSLLRAESTDEKKIGGELLHYFAHHRAQVDLKHLESWLACLEGWEEVDNVCQSVFTDEDLLSDWPTWQRFLRKLTSSSHPSQRRASLVLLTGPVAHSSDKRLTNQAFENIEKLQNDKSILITKAISCLLRELIRHHRT